MLKDGDKGEEVKSLQENLTRLGYRPGKIDGDFGGKTEAAVVRFQEETGLYADGIVGPATQAAIEQALHEQLLEQHATHVGANTNQESLLPFVRVAADAYRDGYDRFLLRSDVAAAYLKVREQVVEAGGVITSSGARRALTARVSPSRSATSFHYTGRALDLHVGSGMENRRRNPYIVTGEGGRRWRVYVRASGGEVMELEAITYGSRKRSKKTTGRFLDLTALFAQAGFERIRARPSFFTGGSWLGAEWWHFQYESGLIEGQSTFGDELLKVYSEDDLQSSRPWEYRNRVFGVNWG
ncbi:MAG: peptidoglycan-binding domain-containing protein [Sedimenticola sp.]